MLLLLLVLVLFIYSWTAILHVLSLRPLHVISPHESRINSTITTIKTTTTITIHNGNNWRTAVIENCDIAGETMGLVPGSDSSHFMGYFPNRWRGVNTESCCQWQPLWQKLYTIINGGKEPSPPPPPPPPQPTKTKTKTTTTTTTETKVSLP